MPIFDFYCEKCEKSFEVTIMVKEKEPEKCPICGSKKISKLFNFTCKTPRKAKGPDSPQEVGAALITFVSDTLTGKRK